MLKRVLKILIGLVFLPFCIGASRALYVLLINIHGVGRMPVYFIRGVICYVVVHLLLFQPDYLYVFGHESVHAVFTWIFGGKVKSFRVSKAGGSVATTKTNFIISLAPYFFPVYTVSLSLIFLGIRFFFPGVTQYTKIFIFLAGFSLAFHFVMTAVTLKTKQPDLIENGRLFSLTLIYLINILILVLSLSLVFKNAQIASFFKQAFYYSRETVINLWKMLFVVE